MKMTLAALLVALCGGAVDSRAEDLISFCAMGDVPYAPFENKLLPKQIEQLPDDIAFAIHLGDIKPGGAPCGELVYKKVASMLGESKAPMFIIPGDNEWNDCAQPAAAWQHWVGHFDRFDEKWDKPFEVERDAKQSANFAFLHEQVLFIGLNVVGGKVHDAAEWQARHAACMAWFGQQLAAHGAAAKAVVVFVHARPSPTQVDFFLPFSIAAGGLGKPVLLMHGDGHVWIHDRPFLSKQVERVEVDQGRLGPPVRVTVTDDAKEPFRFDRRLEEQPVVRNFPVEGLNSGPEKGTLVIDGGSGGVDGAKIFQRFVELAGGANAHIVVVPTALSGAENYNLEALKRSKLSTGSVVPASLVVVHTDDPAEAGSEAFVAPIRQATGIWFGGGRQWRLVDAYGGTLAEREFRAVLERGGVIGGSSAGATIQGSFLARGDSAGNTAMLGDHQRGFAYLKNVAIDQHVVARGRQLDMLEILNDPQQKMTPDHDRAALLGLGVDEGTAMVVRGDRFKVIGSPGGSVLVYDPSTWGEGLPDKHKFIRLGTGSEYDLRTRTPVKVVPPAPRKVPPAKPAPKPVALESVTKVP